MHLPLLHANVETLQISVRQRQAVRKDEEKETAFQI